MKILSLFLAFVYLAAGTWWLVAELPKVIFFYKGILSTPIILLLAPTIMYAFGLSALILLNKSAPNKSWRIYLIMGIIIPIVFRLLGKLLLS